MLDKKEALAAAIKQIEKEFGKGSIMRMGEAARLDVKAMPTGILPLDLALGIGGLPRGRIIEIYGPEAGGKTTVSLHIIASVQAHGGTAAFIDAEHALDPVYARRLGVNVDELLIAQPDTGEQGLEIADSLIRSAAVDVVVIDSVAALVPKSEIEGDMGDSHVGLQARMMSQAMRKLTGAIGKTDTIAIFINQIREKVGILFGNPETTPGGRALKFSASVRLEVRKGEAIKQGTDIIGNRVKIKVAKNKVAPPFTLAEFDLIYGEGYSRIGGLIDVGVETEVLTKRGAYIYYNDEKIGQGKDNAKIYLEEHPEKADEIEAKIISSVRNKTVSIERTEEVDDKDEEEFIEDEE